MTKLYPAILINNTLKFIDFDLEVKGDFEFDTIINAEYELFDHITSLINAGKEIPEPSIIMDGQFEIKFAA